MDVHILLEMNSHGWHYICYIIDELFFDAVGNDYCCSLEGNAPNRSLASLSSYL